MIVESELALPYLCLDNITVGALEDMPNRYVISLKSLNNNSELVLKSLANGSVIAIEKTDESISTLWHIVKNKDYEHWIRTGQLRLITSSDSGTEVSNLNSEHFLSATIGSQDTPIPVEFSDQYRPYSFLFTNRKIRPHRRYLILELRRKGLLDHALWSCLNKHSTHGHPEHTRIYIKETDISIKHLDPGYDPIPAPDWIDGVIYPPQYQHTWFTLVSETGFEYPHSFRTEKTWKPILAGHPFIVCANAGFYRDLRNLGFRTFDHLIDESFDSIIDGKDRLDRLIDTVQWLCKQDLVKFWQASREVCLYNHQRALELHNSLARDFTPRLMEFMNA
jgi:hypothetical protein